MRIGQLSDRVGVTPERLRAWERRYRLLHPERTPTGYRLYSEDDERRVRDMLAALGDGLAPAQAAASVLGTRRPEPTAVPATTLEDLVEEMAGAMAAYDGPRAESALDRLFAGFSLETALRDALLPYLHELGEQWVAGEVCVAQEHFASRLIEGRLLSLATGWSEGAGPLALLACPAGEQHTLGLLCFGLALRRRGWRIAYLGADTPTDQLAEVAGSRRPALVVLSSVSAEPFAGEGEELACLAARGRVLVAGAGASPRLAERLGAGLLDSDPVSSAAAV